ncbi:MAG: hypothetical protein ACOX50_00240 [Patescibacteria group bacterium]|jgi:uncharacterized protein YbaR (Trm112 family)
MSEFASLIKGIKDISPERDKPEPESLPSVGSFLPYRSDALVVYEPPQDSLGRVTGQEAFFALEPHQDRFFVVRPACESAINGGQLLRGGVDEKGMVITIEVKKGQGVEVCHKPSEEKGYGNIREFREGRLQGEFKNREYSIEDGLPVLIPCVGGVVVSCEREILNNRKTFIEIMSKEVEALEEVERGVLESQFVG